MAVPKPPEPAVFFVALLAADRACLTAAAAALTDEWGPAMLAWQPVPFVWTRYYENELGPAPLRAFVAWPGSFAQAALAGRKLRANELEADLAAKIGGSLPRPVNLDPGYITLSKLVLASAKDFSHRIYLRDGIYAEITLQYHHKAFHTLPWTFPDYASGAYFSFFSALRAYAKTLPRAAALPPEEP